MREYFTCGKEELDAILKKVYSNIIEIGDDLVMYGQQFEGKRNNMTIDRTKDCYQKLEKIINYLNELGENKKILSFEENMRNLEEKMKEFDY